MDAAILTTTSARCEDAVPAPGAGGVQRMASNPDEQLLKAGQRVESREVFDAIFQRFYAPLARYAHRITGDTASAADVIQDVFLKLWQERRRLAVKTSLQAMLYTMVRNRALKAIRRRKWIATDITAEEALEDAGYESDYDTTIDAEAVQRQLFEWIRELPDRRREAFMLSRYHGLRHNEIADIMGLSQRTVDTHILLALRTLRRRLDEWQKEGSP